MVVLGFVDGPRTSRNFVSYTNSRSMKDKDVTQMRAYLEQLRTIQAVSRTWNFSLSTIEGALMEINKDRRNPSSIVYTLGHTCRVREFSLYRSVTCLIGSFIFVWCRGDIYASFRYKEKCIVPKSEVANWLLG